MSLVKISVVFVLLIFPIVVFQSCGSQTEEKVQKVIAATRMAQAGHCAHGSPWAGRRRLVDRAEALPGRSAGV